MKRILAAAAVVAMAACTQATPGGVTTDGATTVMPGEPASAIWNGFPVRQVGLDGSVLRVAVASSPGERQRGLQGVTGLGELDGMLFEWSELTDSTFWMKDTLITLDIAFFDGSGRLVDVMTMTPCVQETCPTYGPNDPYRWAIEAPAGGVLATVSADSVLNP